ncbi:MAG: S8 family serine peptidase [Labilithrix sp.]|nr:S8 family serine peptidase [Labilithrix sp.]
MSATRQLACRARRRARTLSRVVAIAAITCVFVTDARPARSADPPASAPVTASGAAERVVRGSPIGPGLLHALGPRAADALAPASGLIGALVAVPRGARAVDLGLEPVAPGIGRLRGSSSRIAAYAEAHPDLRIELAPPLHPLMDRASRSVLALKAREVRGADGKGVLVGVADTGLDVTHPEMRDEAGRSRVAWLLDLSLEPGGVHADLEQRFGIKDDKGKVVAGRVFAKQDLDDLLTRIDNGFCTETKGRKCAPSDEIGHGTHVAGIAASSGAKGGKYAGIAPAADVVFVRVTRGASDGIENDDLVRAVEFMFDRADADKRPMVVNLSLGSDFGPHDGTFLWEQAIASHVGHDHPGHVIVAAAGNSGSIVETPIHQSVRVTPGARMRVPIRTKGAESGSVQVWLTLRRGADLKIGLEGPDGEWIAPVERGRQSGKNTNDYNAGVIYGSNLDNSPIPETSRGAVIVWQGKWPSGVYNITLEGSGMAELYMQGLGDAGLGGERPAAFLHGVREGTINLPATHPQIIGVGCTVNRPRWSSIGGADVGLKVPVLDREGGLPIALAVTTQDDAQTHRDLVDGEVCWFSSAGPTATGVPKPEIAAPGALVVSALSRTAKPGSPGSVFTSSTCPVTKSGASDKRCLQIDDSHGIAIGTSMSAPVVAGVVALLLQADPTLTQDKVLALLQAGAHRFRQPALFDDQSGPGEVDALASLDALDQMQNPALHLPAFEQSWVALSSDYVPADGSTPVTAIIELRTADGAHRGDFFEAERLQPVLLVDGKAVNPAPVLVRRGPGVWFFAWEPPAGLGGSRATFGATFDGAPIVAPRTLPIAPDRWTAVYPSHAKGSSCASTAGTAGGSGALAWLGLALAAALFRRRAQGSSATVTSQPCGSHTSSSGSNA